MRPADGPSEQGRGQEADGRAARDHQRFQRRGEAGDLGGPGGDGEGADAPGRPVLHVVARGGRHQREEDRQLGSTKKTKHHLTGAEADEFIRTNIKDYGHLKPFVEAAVGAGKKGEGYVASISPEDWAIVYGVEFPTDSEAEQKSTNAYASTKNADGPAILHADRGTPSTAIHESMHRYAPDDVLDTYGFDLNEGITEYFTRILTDQNAAPAKNGGPERTNYPSQVAFVREMISILGGSKTEQETVLAQIYFEGKLTCWRPSSRPRTWRRRPR